MVEPPWFFVIMGSLIISNYSDSTIGWILVRLTCDIKSLQVLMSESAPKLRDFFSVRIEAGSSFIVEQPYGTDYVITQVSVAEDAPEYTRAQLFASVDTMQMDQPNVDGERPEVHYNTLIASFLPNSYPSKNVNLAFTTTDLCTLEAFGAPFIVTGYIMPSSVKMAQYAAE